MTMAEKIEVIFSLIFPVILLFCLRRSTHVVDIISLQCMVYHPSWGRHICISKEDVVNHQFKVEKGPRYIVEFDMASGRHETIKLDVDSYKLINAWWNSNDEIS